MQRFPEDTGRRDRRRFRAVGRGGSVDAVSPHREQFKLRDNFLIWLQEPNKCTSDLSEGLTRHNSTTG